MATWTQATAIPTGGLITSAWMNTTTAAINFLGAGSNLQGKDLALLRQTTNQTGLTASTYNVINWSSADFDVASGFSVGTSASRYIAKAAGKYRIQAHMYMAAGGTNATQNIVFRLYKNGTSQSGFTHSVPNRTASIAGHYATPVWLISLAANDYIELYLNADWTAATGSNTLNSTLSIEWVGA
jgi:hypothetical protein